MSDSHHAPEPDHGHAPCAQGTCGHAAAPAEHAHADDPGHGHAEEHGHGHGDDHGGHGGGGEWSDYNAKAPVPSTLPPLGAPAMAVLGLILAGVLTLIVTTSLSLAAQPHGEHGRGPSLETEHSTPENAH